MRKYSYHFEQLDLITLFVAAFDDAFLYRYDAATRQPKERVDVRYIFGPKHRVLHDLTDRAKNLTLPVVTIEQTQLSRDSTRVHNKGKFFTQKSLGETGKISKIPAPVPVNLSLTVNIIGKFKEDIDQIIQNFVTFCNPYIIAYWKVPESFGMDYINELRSEIQWSGDVSYDNPKDLSPETKWRISAETTFTIKGWLFPPHEERQAPIYTVRTEFQAVNLENRVYTYDDFPALSGNEYQTEVITVSAFPEFTNFFYEAAGSRFEILQPASIENDNENTFIFYGKRFDYNNTWYLSSNVPNFALDYQEVITDKGELISAYRLPASFIQTRDGNVAKVKIPPQYLLSAGPFTFITANSARWTSMGHSGIFIGNNVLRYYLYLQPDGESLYLQPDGESKYIFPTRVSQEILQTFFIQPDGTSLYLQPNGISLYHPQI